MKKNVLILIQVLFFGAVYAQSTPDSPELVTLRASWTKARDQATLPIDQKYVGALKALKDRFTKAGNLDAAIQADAELKKLSTASRSENHTSSVSPSILKLFVDKTWITSTGTTKYTFRDNGRGTATTDSIQDGFSWELQADSTVKVTRNDQVLFFTFKSETEASHISKTDPKQYRDLRPSEK